MPQLNSVKTVSSQVAWTSPDGQRTIYKVNMDYQGKPFQASTYSKAIGQVGWLGDIETYEKSNNKGGSDTYVKQQQKEGYAPGGYSNTGRQPKPQSNTTMFVSYAKDLAVALQMTEGFDRAKFEVLLQGVIEGGRTLSQADYESKPVNNEVHYEPIDNVIDPDSVPGNVGDQSWLNDLPTE
jgi:hypothetical protein